MFDIAADIFRALITGAIFFYLRAMRGKESPRLRKAWIFLVIGFGLLFLAGLLNVADNFPSLGKYIVVGRTRTADFLEQVIGYVFGLLFLGISQQSGTSSKRSSNASLAMPHRKPPPLPNRKRGKGRPAWFRHVIHGDSRSFTRSRRPARWRSSRGTCSAASR
jgi:hypothetical protein